MQFEPLAISDVIKITPRTFGDDRGEFMETFRASNFNDAVGRNVEFVQGNHLFPCMHSQFGDCIFKARPLPKGNWCVA